MGLTIIIKVSTVYGQAVTLRTNLRAGFGSSKNLQTFAFCISQNVVWPDGRKLANLDWDTVRKL